MTYSTTEFALNRSVSPEVLEWRSWRRRMHLTIPEAAAMADVDALLLQRIEVGKRPLFGERRPGRSIWPRLQALMQRWKGHEP